ncbi:MAG: dihydrolipoyllysine-residue succinyltransferase, partial [Chloroflexota bacterium]
MADQSQAYQIVVPELGESVLEATVSRWIKKEGERVNAGEPVVELETDKVNLEVGATRAGILKRIERQESEDVKVGDVLGLVEPVEAGAPQETDGDQGPDGRQVAKAAAPQEAAQETPPVPARETPPSEAGQESRPAPAGPAAAPIVTPVAAQMAQEMGVDLAQVQGSGPGGRVTKADIENHLAKSRPAGQPTAPEPKGATAAPAQTPAPRPADGARAAAPKVTAGDGRREERVKMSRRRRTIAARLVEAQQTAAMLTTFNEVDMSAVMDLRQRRNESFLKRYEIKLGITSFFVKASIAALKAFSPLNGEVQGDEMILKHYYDIGIAVGAPEGLVVPVLRDADR